MSDFRININIDEIADQLHKEVGQIQSTVEAAVKGLSIAAHAFIINKAQTELSGYKREAFLGPDNKNVRWIQIDNGIWVVEIAKEAEWIELGRPSVSMATEDWLLKPGKVKVAKDGSTYRHIPFVQGRGKTGGKLANVNPNLSQIVKDTLKENRLSLNKIEKNADGSPKLGVLHRLSMKEPSRTQYSDLFSKPRTAEMAEKTGLKPHGGIFYGKGLVITQRMGAGGKVIREAMTFRTVSSKHRAENRWMYPTVQPFNSIQAAYEWSQQQMNEIIRQIENEINQQDPQT